MKLLLVRHADAGDAADFARTGKPDSERPLSDEGRKEMRAVARGLREIVSNIDRVVSSPYVRAVQTATILREAYDIGSLSETPTLQPESRPSDFEKWLADHRDDKVIAAVGHEPNLGILATWFLAGKLDSCVRMKKAGACLLDFDDQPRKGEGVLHWLMTAGHLRSLALRVIIAVTCLLSPGVVMAQTYWRVPAAVGSAYLIGGTGFVLDGLRGLDQPTSPRYALFAFGAVSGGLLGYFGGLEADRILARGDTLKRDTRTNLRIATFLTPVAVGTTAAYLIISGPPEEPRCVPSQGGGCTWQQPPPRAISDERIAAVTIGGGVIVGILAQNRFARALHPRTHVGVAPDGRGLSISIPMGR